ncbi:histone deacetylase [Leptospira perolatii]|uniref:Histone deacetylase n=1 Tax=Leptospira perolatii TaxID=2023191 RepID=A0A2M9ZHZ8_9LEPT|nr:histone deacetylase [Leptospira perolatii]PJZ68032.1 histone deacetylase [Leptospira perolatii]PJZ71688.1 histone deacetylase [Leptospira perolatii]
MRLGYSYSDHFLNHKTGDFHPECPERLEAIMNRLSRASYFSSLVPVAPELLDPKFILSTHSQSHLTRFLSMNGKEGAMDGDTPYSRGSFQAALLAAGSGVCLSKKILAGELDAGIALVRPPGHHAETGRAMGFCFLNNIALSANFLLSQGVKRIYILDWDVHHGNGTQEIFYRSPDVFFTSIHRYPFYPGTGSKSETGEGDGTGTTLNLPMSGGSSDSQYLNCFKNTIIPSILEFHPEFILISAGFDAHREDPLGGMNLSTNAYQEFTKLVKEAASQIGAKIVSFLEGGYDLVALAESVESHIGVLHG